MKKRKGQKGKAKSVQEKEGSSVLQSDDTETEEEEEVPKTTASTRRVRAFVRRVNVTEVQGQGRFDGVSADRNQLLAGSVPSLGASPLCGGASLQHFLTGSWSGSLSLTGGDNT